MTANKKKPDTYSASTTARVISRKLRAAGLPMADTSNRYHWTEGFHVHRVGCSSTVSIGYHIPHEQRYSPEQRERRIAAIDGVKELLALWGYEVKTPGIYVECEWE